MNRTLDEALRIQARAAGRLADLAGDEHDRHPTETTLMRFHRDPAHEAANAATERSKRMPTSAA